jgi:hypothetical protein
MNLILTLVPRAVFFLGAILPLQEGVFSRSADENSSDNPPVTSEMPATEDSSILRAKDPKIKPIVSQNIDSSSDVDSNVVVSSQSDGWFTISDKASGTQFRLPGALKYKARSWSPVANRRAVVNHRFFTNPDRYTSFEFSWMDLHDAHTTQAKLDDTLDGVVRGSVNNTFGNLKSTEKVTLGNLQGREFSFSFTMQFPSEVKKANKDKTPIEYERLEFFSHSKVFVNGKRRYQMDVITLKSKWDDVSAEKFFNSLIIDENEK